MLANLMPFIPPISLNPVSGMSLDHSFPHIKPALQLAISRHDFHPRHLYKLETSIKEKPRSKTFEISEQGDFTQWESDGSPKDYPSFQSLFDPLMTYFEILQFFIISSGNVPTIQQVVLGCSEYLRILYQIYSKYEWHAVIKYHFMFHSHRLAEMHDGDYSGWRTIDPELASLYLYGNTKPHVLKSTPSSSSTAKQSCFSFQSGKCPSPCAHGYIHKCCKCDSPDHGKYACPKKAEAGA